MYAISFDLDTNHLKEHYRNDSYTNAWYDIKVFLLEKGFKWQQGSVYFGNEEVNAVTCVMAIQELSREHPWFKACVKDIRMLRIEENNDLMPAVTNT